MSLQLRQLVQVDISGKYIWSTDKSGAYDPDTNTGGWGNPNPELSESALLVIAIRKASATALSFVSAHQIIYDSGATNADEFQWQMNYPSQHGHIQVWMMRIWVSDDGIIDKSGDHAIEEGDFFFIPANPDTVFMKTGSGVDAVEEVTDLTDLINSEDETNPYQIICEDLFINLLAKKAARLMKEKILARQRENTSQFEDLRDQITDITQGIQSADYAFRGGLTVEANAQIESLTDEYLNP